MASRGQGVWERTDHRDAAKLTDLGDRRPDDFGQIEDVPHGTLSIVQSVILEDRQRAYIRVDASGFVHLPGSTAILMPGPWAEVPPS
jgi:hypothetical protein